MFGRRWGALFGLAPVAIVAACSTGDHPNGANGDGIDHPHGTTGGECAVPDDGCPCSDEGALVECGAFVATDANAVPSCEKGFRRCSHGSWGACDTLTNVTPSGPTHVAAPSATRGTCTSAPCDPNCVGDFTDTTLDGGLTLEAGGDGTFGKRPNGPPPASITATLAAAGITDPGIYHELDPGDTATDPVTLTATMNPVDVYFLLNSTTAMQPIIGNLSSSIDTIVSKLQAKLPNVAFGDGRFSNYLAWPYASQQHGNTVYENRVNLSTDATQTVNDIHFINANASTLLVDTPYVQAQAATPALYAMATGEEMNGWFSFDSGDFPDWWWNVFAYYGSDPFASLNWPPFVAQAPGCSGGGVGYPCFRPGAYHIVMLMMDSPAMNGPGGSFPYYQFKPRYFPPGAAADYTTANEWYWWYSSSLGTGATPHLPTDKGTTATNTIDRAAGQPQVYIGNLLGGSSRYQVNNTNSVGPGGATYPYSASAVQKCYGGGYIGTGPDTTYDFTAAAPMHFWFDTVGTSFDTVLYLIDLDTNETVACMDDSFPWLSAEDISGSGVDSTIRLIGQLNSGIVGDIPAGHYRLVVDTYANFFPNDGSMSNRGSYQINLWPIIDDPRYGGNPQGKDVSTPSYNQMLTALRNPALNAYVIGLEASGYDCGQSPSSWERAFTHWSLANVATDTNALAGGSPVVISVKQDGSPGPAGAGATSACPSAASFGDLVADEVATMTDNIAKPVNAVGFDYDNNTDFDGVTGSTAGPTVLTPFDVDDATFVSKITANPVTGCTVNATGDAYTTCAPGSVPNFSVSFAVPGTVPKRANPQIFHFRIDMKSGATVLGSQAVTIVVPPYSYSPTDYVRDFDGSTCPSGYQVGWKNYHWSTSTPSDSKIQFFVTTATTASGLDSAPEQTPAFAVAEQTPGPDTQLGAVDLGAYLAGKTPDLSHQPFVRVRAHLKPSTDGTVAPTLSSWYLEMDCVPNE